MKQKSKVTAFMLTLCTVVSVQASFMDGVYSVMNAVPYAFVAGNVVSLVSTNWDKLVTYGALYKINSNVNGIGKQVSVLDMKADGIQVVADNIQADVIIANANINSVKQTLFEHGQKLDTVESQGLAMMKGWNIFQKQYAYNAQQQLHANNALNENILTNRKCITDVANEVAGLKSDIQDLKTDVKNSMKAMHKDVEAIKYLLIHGTASNVQHSREEQSQSSSSSSNNQSPKIVPSANNQISKNTSNAIVHRFNLPVNEKFE